jgi:arylsulfatase A
VNFNDFYATFSDILNVSDDSDGKSMMDIFTKEKQLKRDIVTIYYDSKWGNNKYRNVFSQNKRYKLYKNGNFFDMEKDILERSPLLENELSKDQKLIKKMLASDLSNFPDVPLLKK